MFNINNKFVRTRSLIAPMTDYLIKYATSKSMRINHNICNNARMRKRNRSRMRKKIGHAELLSNGATARYTQEPSQKKRPQIQTIKNIWRTNRNQPQTTNIPHLTSIQTKNTKKTKKKKTHIWEHTYTKLQTHVKDNVFGRMIAREFCKYILTNSKNTNGQSEYSSAETLVVTTAMRPKCQQDHLLGLKKVVCFL